MCLDLLPLSNLLLRPCKDEYPRARTNLIYKCSDNSSFRDCTFWNWAADSAFSSFSLQVEEILDESSHLQLLLGQLLLQFHEMYSLKNGWRMIQLTSGKQSCYDCAVFWIFFKQDIQLGWMGFHHKSTRNKFLQYLAFQLLLAVFFVSLQVLRSA